MVLGKKISFCKKAVFLCGPSPCSFHKNAGLCKYSSGVSVEWTVVFSGNGDVESKESCHAAPKY